MTRFHYLSIVLLCFTLHQINAQSDAKTAFGETFGRTLKTLTLQLAENFIKASLHFHEALLRDASTSEGEAKNYGESLNKLADIKQRLESNDKQTIIAALHELKSVELRKISDISFQKSSIKESSKFHAVTVAMDLYDDEMTEAAKTFILSSKQKWQEMFKQLPAAELAKHPEFADINENMSQLSVEEHASKDVFNKAMLAIFNAFGYDEWKILLNED